MQNWQGVFQGEGHLEVRGYRQRMTAIHRNAMQEDECAAFFDRLGEAERPLIYAGGGVINGEASEALRAFSRATSASRW